MRTLQLQSLLRTLTHGGLQLTNNPTSCVQELLQEAALAALPPGEDGGWAACAGGLGPRAFCSAFDVMPT